MKTMERYLHRCSCGTVFASLKLTITNPQCEICRCKIQPGQRPKGRPRIPAQDDPKLEQIVTLRRQGMKIDEIALEVGYSPYRVSILIRRAGYKSVKVTRGRHGAYHITKDTERLPRRTKRTTVPAFDKF